MGVTLPSRLFQALLQIHRCLFLAVEMGRSPVLSERMAFPSSRHINQPHVSAAYCFMGSLNSEEDFLLRMGGWAGQGQCFILLRREWAEKSLGVDSPVGTDAQP